MEPLERAGTARTLRKRGDYRSAGEQYVASGFGHLMAFRDLGDDSIAPKEFGRATQMLFLGALCFRIICDEERARRYSSIGTELAIDIRKNEAAFRRPDAPAPIGLTYEFEGDFRFVGDLGDFEEAYDRARGQYEQVKEPYQWCVEPEFEVPLLVLLDLADSVGFDISEDERAAIQTSLVDRIEFKREHFGTIIEGVIDDGNWESDIW